MGWIKKLVNRQQYKKDLADAQALDSFLKNAPMDLQESRQNIQDSLIELLCYGKHSSNGILVTTSGYFVTAKHCVEDLEGIRIRDSIGNEYDFDRVCCYIKDQDIALAKAHIDVAAEPRRYMVDTNSMLAVNSGIILLRYNEGQLEHKFGFLCGNFNNFKINRGNGETIVFQDHLKIDVHTFPGWSGSVVADITGNVLGIISSGGPIPISGAARFTEAFKLIKYQRDKLLTKKP